MSNEQMKAEESITEEKIENRVEVPVEQTEKPPERVMSKGEERYNAITQSIGKAREKVGGWIKNGASKFGKFLKAGAVGALNTPENIGAAGNFIDKKGQESGDWVYNQANSFDKYTDKKTEQAGAWIGRNLASADDYIGRKAEGAANWAADKTEQAGNYLKDKALLAEAVASLAKEKTVEKLNVAKEGIGNGYNKVVEFGKRGVDFASRKIREAKEANNKKRNAWIKGIMERKAELEHRDFEAQQFKADQKREKFERTRAKLQEMEQFKENTAENTGMENNLAAA